MPSLSPVSRRELIRCLRAYRFVGPYVGGRHEFMIMGPRRLVLPYPHRGDLSIDLLARLLRQAGITSEEWAALAR